MSYSKVDGMNLVEYLQQPSSIYALSALALNTQADGLLGLRDMVDYFVNQDVIANVPELKQRWADLEKMGFAVHAPGGCLERVRAKLGWRIGYVLTVRGDKAAETLTEAINTIKRPPK
jgi:hypothetical protein